MKTFKYVVPAIVAAMLLFVALLTTLSGGPAVQAAPSAAPTPISVSQSLKEASEIAFFATVVLTEGANSAASVVKNFQLTDIQYNIDQALVNTVTMKLQFSNDNANWTDGVTLVSANAADASVLGQQALFGKFARVNVAVSNTNPVTVTALAVLK